MVDLGANPFVFSNTGRTQFGIWRLSNLTSLPSLKSVYFPVRSFACCSPVCKFDLSEPWFYKNGAFPAEFQHKLGEGASSTVIRGTFQQKDAAFKFVKIRKEHQLRDQVMDALNDLNKQLSEMTSIQSTMGNKIVKFYGHFR